MVWEIFETWVKGGNEGNTIKIWLCLTISITVLSPNKAGHMLLLIIQLSGSTEQQWWTLTDNSCSQRVGTIKGAGKRSPSCTLNWRGAHKDTPMGQHRQVTRAHCWQQCERAEGMWESRNKWEAGGSPLSGMAAAVYTGSTAVYSTKCAVMFFMTQVAFPDSPFRTGNYRITDLSGSVCIMLEQ